MASQKSPCQNPPPMRAIDDKREQSGRDSKHAERDSSMRRRAGYRSTNSDTQKNLLNSLGSHFAITASLPCTSLALSM